jgi:hypothetical protein
MYAAWKGYLEIAKLLLQNGADANAKLATGFTALKFAESYDHKDIVELLSTTGKTPSRKS